MGDPLRLRQVLLNLVGNAIKFTEEGEIVIHVRCESWTEKNVILHFEVRDTGIGIPTEKQAVIFEAFAQADGSTTRKYGGTGLGLTISSQLVRSMGGSIRVESQPGKGSTFSFEVPLGLAPQQEKRSQSGPIPTLENLPVLVVDDNPTNRHILQDMLTNLGYEADAGRQRPGRPGPPSGGSPSRPALPAGCARCHDARYGWLRRRRQDQAESSDRWRCNSHAHFGQQSGGSSSAAETWASQLSWLNRFSSRSYSMPSSRA